MTILRMRNMKSIGMMNKTNEKKQIPFRQNQIYKTLEKEWFKK